MKTASSTAILIADLGYGDAGKGSIVDALTRKTQAHSVVRYNGGAQAAHHVVTPDGRQHTFSQFGSATFHPGTRTYLSRYMMLHPLAMLSEEEHLRMIGVRDAFERCSIDAGALVTTPFHQAANRLKEIARGSSRHGSCGMGIGETMADWLATGEQALFAGDLGDRAQVMRKLAQIRDMKVMQLGDVLDELKGFPLAEKECKQLLDSNLIEITADIYAYFASRVAIVGPEHLRKVVRSGGVIVFEGAQGVLLDEWYGFSPYNTWSTLTYKNAEALLAESDFPGDVLRLGVIRGYATRHGAGPFVSEDAQLTALLPDSHNMHNPWQRDFRVGYLDTLALRYALCVTGGVDGLVVTNLDRMPSLGEWRICDAYRTQEDSLYLDEFFERIGKMVTAIQISTNPADLVREQERTRLLMAMQPVYMTLPRQVNAYLETIEGLLNSPVVITSSGPAAGSKAYHRGVLDMAAARSLRRNSIPCVTAGSLKYP